MKLYEMKEEARTLALRMVGRRVAKRMSEADVQAVEDTAIHFYHNGKLSQALGLEREWSKVALVLEGLLMAAVRADELHRPSRKVTAPLGGVGGVDRQKPVRYQDDEGFWRSR